MPKMYTPWTEYMEPFKIKGNLYFVGCVAASSHLIATSEGLILLDTGYPQNLYMVIDGIYKLGFSPYDIKYIIHSHGHYDHLGGTKALVELTGAKTFIGAGDEDYANGKLDLTWAKELGYDAYHEAFEPDFILHDGDKITLGEVEMEFAAAPGHTPGTLAIFFNITDEGKEYKVAMHGGVGFNSMSLEFLDKYGLCHDCRQKFVDAIDRIIDRPVDIFIGNHVWNNDTKGKYQKILDGDKDAFVDPAEWKRFLQCQKEEMLKWIAEGK